ncbi:MAG: tRNA glutamyl-Q(34) synthetase GluQRS [Methylococcaceae bacterium]
MNHPPSAPATPPIRHGSRQYKGRFAPSPTGPLHPGSLFTALASYLDARSAGGFWFVRIDDLDPLRSRSEMADRILHSLDALHLHWDGSVLYQSHRMDAYQAALDHLLETGLAYPCVCSRKDLAQHMIYPGTCRTIRSGLQAPHAIRVRVTDTAWLIEDALQGPRTIRLDLSRGDFIIYRRDKVFAYHLATVMDDAQQGITHVLRGIDLLEVTAEQTYLRSVLQLAHPVHAHIPVLVDGQHQKLSKQTHAPEACVRQPSRLLIQLLGLLKQQPPTDLQQELPETILNWAIKNWNPTILSGLSQIALRP